MATTTLQVARRALAKQLGYFEELGQNGLAWSTTTDVAASALVISTELRDAGFDDFGEAGSGDARFENNWVWLLGTNNSQVQRMVKSYDASAGELTVTGTNLSAESGSTDFEIHRYPPAFLNDALNVARIKAYPALHVPVRRTVFTAQGQRAYEVPSAIRSKPSAIYLRRPMSVDFTNNILSNPGFEDWTSGSADSWTEASGITEAEETVTTDPTNYAVLLGDSSARLTNGDTGTARTYDQTISSPDTHSGQRVAMYIWVYCLASSSVATAITINSTTHVGSLNEGGEHRGTGWELLTHYEDATTTVSTLKIGIEFLAAAATSLEIYVDQALAVVGPVQEPERHSQIIRQWEYRPLMEGTTTRHRVVFPYEFEDNYLLEFEGTDYLSSVSAESDTFEIGNPEAELLYKLAAREVFQRYANVTSEGDANFEARRLQMINREIEGEMLTHAMWSPKSKMLVPDA